MSFNGLGWSSLHMMFYRDLKFDIKTGVVPTENSAGCLIGYINCITVRIEIFSFCFVLVLWIYCHDLVIRQGVWIDYWMYWTLVTTRNYDSFTDLRCKSLLHTSKILYLHRALLGDCNNVYFSASVMMHSLNGCWLASGRTACKTLSHGPSLVAYLFVA
jgi:hypothetical protein